MLLQQQGFCTHSVYHLAPIWCCWGHSHPSPLCVLNPTLYHKQQIWLQLQFGTQLQLISILWSSNKSPNIRTSGRTPGPFGQWGFSSWRVSQRWPESHLAQRQPSLLKNYIYVYLSWTGQNQMIAKNTERPGLTSLTLTGLYLLLHFSAILKAITGDTISMMSCSFACNRCVVDLQSQSWYFTFGKCAQNLLWTSPCAQY